MDIPSEMSVECARGDIKQAGRYRSLYSDWGLGLGIEIWELSVMGMNYPLVQGDREKEKGTRKRTGDSTMKRAEQGGRNYPKEKERESERRAPEGRMHPQSQEDRVF